MGYFVFDDRYPSPRAWYTGAWSLSEARAEARDYPGHVIVDEDGKVWPREAT